MKIEIDQDVTLEQFATFLEKNVFNPGQTPLERLVNQILIPRQIFYHSVCDESFPSILSPPCLIEWLSSHEPFVNSNVGNSDLTERLN